MSYSEILAKVPVAKSTLSLWLRSVGLSRRQKQRLTRKKWLAIKRGLAKWRKIRIDKTRQIIESSQEEIKKVKATEDKLWLMGIMLYWAEGAKIKNHRPSQNISFSNSDPLMIKLFILWLKKILRISVKNIKFDVYIHEVYRARAIEIRKYWARVTGFSQAKFDKIYFKKHKLETVRKNTGDSYHGLLRVQVRKSTDLNRKIVGWTKGVCQQWGIV